MGIPWLDAIGVTTDETLLLGPMEGAHRRLGAAVKAERETSHLPPSCDSRQKVTAELHRAEAVAAEFCS